MKISVNKYTLEPATVDGGTAGSHGMESLEFDFSPEWDGLSRTVTFFPPKSAAKCVSMTGDSVPLPSEVTKRAGKTSYVLCGARDGAAVITVTGVIKVAESLIPDEAEITEYTPGALEQAAILCAEARTDAMTTAELVNGVCIMRDTVQSMANEVEEAYDIITAIHDEVTAGTAVHPQITDANRSDSAHPVSVAGVLAYMDALLNVVCPLNCKCVSELPSSPDTNTVYIKDGVPMVYINEVTNDNVFKWMPQYLTGGGPAEIYTVSQEIDVGTVLYWCGSTTLESMDDLIVYDTVSAISGDTYTVSQYGDLTLTYLETVSLSGTSEHKAWAELTEDVLLTPYLKDNPGKWVITGGAA